MKVMRESFQKGICFIIVGEGLDPKTIPFTSTMTENILSIEKNASSSKAISLIIEQKINILAIIEN
jgi:hypothetical protein